MISCSKLITYIFQNLQHHFLHCYNSTKLYHHIQNLSQLVQLFVSLSFYLSVSVELIHHVTLLLTPPLLRMDWLMVDWLMVDYPHIISFDASTTVDPNPIDVLKSYDETEGSTLFLLPILKKNVVVFISFLFMASVFNVRMIFTFCPILTFRFRLFILNSILTFFRYCYYFIYTDIAYMIYYNFLMISTNSFSDVPSKLRSCYYVFQKMLLTFSFLHPTENLIQCPFQQAGLLLFFGLCCFCLNSKCSYFLNNIGTTSMQRLLKFLSRSFLTIFGYAYWSY